MDSANTSEHEEQVKLKELEQLKTDLINAAAHEFRTPLTSIAVAIDMVKNNIKNHPLEKNLAQYVSIIQNECSNLTAIVDDLLDISKMEAKKLMLHKEEISLFNLIESVVQTFDTLSHKHNISISIENNTTVHIFADKKQIKRVVANLIANAIKFSPRGGMVSISYEVINTSSQVQLKIRDQGIGLQPEELTKIFEKFYRIKSEETISKPGHGLGLAIVKNIIEIHKGSISVESTYDQGSTFTICLPL